MAHEAKVARDRYDVVVVGARCAGASTALLMARAGLRVLAVEQGRYGADTLSTLALMRAGVVLLDRWGILESVREAGTPPIRNTSFHYGGESIALAIKPRDGVDALFAPRRRLLDRILVDAARAEGAEIVHETRVVGLLRSPTGRVSGLTLERRGERREVAADLVVGADGLRSVVAREVGAQPYRVGRHAGGVVYAFWRGLPPDGNQWYYAPGSGAGAIPTNDGLTLVFASTSDGRFDREIRRDLQAGYLRLVHEAAPELAERLRGCSRVGGLHGFQGVRGYVRRAHGSGWALVGDAGYFKDPITAHGITDALRDAQLLARAVVDGAGSADPLMRYEAERNTLSFELFDITDAIASYAWTLAELRELHLALSREMNREADALALSLPRTPLPRLRSA